MRGGISPVFFFFQAEDGIRDTSVTGVQTCALPISFLELFAGVGSALVLVTVRIAAKAQLQGMRSEERRVGKECRSRRSAGREKKKDKKGDMDGARERRRKE